MPVVWFFVKLVIAVGLSLLLAPKPQSSNANPATKEDFDVPTAEDGKEMPVIFGEIIVQSSNIVWYGDLKSVAVYE